MYGRETYAENGQGPAEGPADGLSDDLCSGHLPALACLVSWLTTMVTNSHHFVFWESKYLWESKYRGIEGPFMFRQISESH
jgi:hypothetical protein